ncbi:hypothetical protein KKG05_02095, partial [bacterium]|nr:hypothetical protein [bacterium]
MNLDQWTIKAQEALQAAQTEARERNHQALTPLHLLAGVLKDSAGIAAQIFEKLGNSPEDVARLAGIELAKEPAVTGSVGS